MISQSVSVVNQLGMHARAAAKFVHLAARYQSRVKVARHGREMDGKSILGTVAARGGKGLDDYDLGRRSRRTVGRRGAGGAGRVRLRRGRMQRLTGIGVSPGMVSGRAVILIQRAQVLRYRIAPVRIEHELERLDAEHAVARDSSFTTSARGSRGGEARNWRRSSTRSC